ncbi:PepSY domain-containing protein [Bosea rubneri]|uniref:PepSY domain-containing protein n=1 Tax=Bosea rubneri TaxID=3075434 RepID=A0ABU3SFU2_9HYPH|nr:PepSY domain-containing protein [Bosea sp. ZW T0_25]MDU0343652.1 PepSY domain-containing protein [Bosea sp. ZW T0_25]
MKNLFTVALVAATLPLAAMAQAPSAATPTSPTNAPLPGANSFTEGQAKSRLEANGYTAVTGLKKDDNGVWKGSAMSAGAQVNVSVDYRGNIVRN